MQHTAASCRLPSEDHSTHLGVWRSVLQPGCDQRRCACDHLGICCVATIRRMTGCRCSWCTWTTVHHLMEWLCSRSGSRTATSQGSHSTQFSDLPLARFHSRLSHWIAFGGFMRGHLGCQGDCCRPRPVEAGFLVALIMRGPIESFKHGCNMPPGCSARRCCPNGWPSPHAMDAVQ